MPKRGAIDNGARKPRCRPPFTTPPRPRATDGAAGNLQEPVNFYNKRFNMVLDAMQRDELIASLNSL